VLAWDNASVFCGMIVGEMRMWVRQNSVCPSNGKVLNFYAMSNAELS